MRFYPLSLFLVCFLVFSCKSSEENKEAQQSSMQSKIEVQGHRGERGYHPENSIPAFLSAIKRGVDVIEMDVVVSKDSQVVVSHEAFMSSLYMLTPQGGSISTEEEKSFNLYEMSYDSIKQFDGGSKGNQHFPQQKKIKTYKPLLTEVIDSVENFIASEGLKPVNYNIEIKSEASEYGRSQPQPEEFVRLVMNVIEEKQIAEKVILQSFDPEILNVLHQEYPEMEISYLVEQNELEENLKLLNFRPDIYSPYFKMIKNRDFVSYVKEKGMKLIPWTVNNEEDIQQMIRFEVDGIITDYPDRVISQF